ncbi:MAG: hypothetical protein Q9162_002011 [Coniocarpon cinnabarinum]
MLDAEEPEAEAEATQELDNSMQEQEEEEGEENEEEDDEAQETAKAPTEPSRNDAQTDDRTREYRTPERNLPPSMVSPTFSDKAQMSQVRPEMVTAETYDIAPTIAAPHSTSINAITATSDMRWVFSGGGDGWIRKFNWVDTVNAKTLLTVAQRHPFVDSVTKAGVLMSYWENEEPSESKPGSGAPQDPEEALPLSAVYSLAVHPQALWLLSGTEVGAINLQSVRHQEGKRITSLIKHTSAVSVMQLSQDNQSFLSGSWDKVILDWDLNTGQTKRNFMGSRGQISAIEIRPQSSLPMPRDSVEQPLPNGFTTNNADEPKLQSAEEAPKQEVKSADDMGSPMGSLFGDNADHNSLFGEDPTVGGGSGGMFEENDEFSRAIANGISAEEDTGHDASTEQATQELPEVNGVPSSLDNIPQPTSSTITPNNTQPTSTFPDVSNTLVNGHAHSNHSTPLSAPQSPPDATQTSDTVFLDAAIDGPLRIWDRRQPNPIARILPTRNTPPWCMHATWSPDGNTFYAGRRNGTVEEYSLHASLSTPTRTLKFPSGSGAVTSLRAMPNQRHLICASYDILRLYDLSEEARRSKKVPFTIVPGHRTGVVSCLFLGSGGRFLISTGGNRGWEGGGSEVLLGYEIGVGGSS